MELLQVDLMDEAQKKLSDFIGQIPVRTKKVSLREGAYTRLASDIPAPEDVPLFHRSTVDGYAVIAADTYGASESIPTFLKVVEEVMMGRAATASLKSGQCAYVPTGGMIPEGADAMVMVEYCESLDDGTVAVCQPVAVGRDIVRRGDDMKEGSIVLKAGTVLRPQEIAALAALGIDQVEVEEPFRTAIISTGDELVPVGGKPKAGQIRESNSYAIKAQAERAGMEVVSTAYYPDNEEVLEAGIRQAMECCDFVFLSGGSSQGKKDMTARLFDKVSNGGVCTHGLALKPGKPTILGWDKVSSTVLVGLPGHPSAASIVFELLVARTLRLHRGQPYQPYVEAKTMYNIASAPGRGTCMPVILHRKEEGFEAEPVLGRSGNWSILVKADGYFLLDHNQEGIKAGETVKVYLFER